MSQWICCCRREVRGRVSVKVDLLLQEGSVGKSEC